MAADVVSWCSSKLLDPAPGFSLFPGRSRLPVPPPPPPPPPAPNESRLRFEIVTELSVPAASRNWQISETPKPQEQKKNNKNLFLFRTEDDEADDNPASRDCCCFRGAVKIGRREMFHDTRGEMFHVTPTPLAVAEMSTRIQIPKFTPLCRRFSPRIEHFPREPIPLSATLRPAEPITRALNDTALR